MSLKNIICILIFTCTVSACRKSLVFVMDSTGSMKDEIHILKNHINASWLTSIQSSDDNLNYILVSYKDPDVGIPLMFSSPEGLVNSINEIEVIGGQGNDCPENSLSAIKRALEVSKNKSTIFLFTDAPANDIDKLPTIETLCRQSQSQVVTFLSGECPGDSGNSMTAYSELSKLCSGTVFHLDIQQLPQAFKFMKEVLKVEWSKISPHKEFIGSKQFYFNVNAYTKDLMIAVSGDYPWVQITNDRGEVSALDRVVDSRRALVIRLLRPELGNYSSEIRSRGSSLVTFYMWKELKFSYGFSPRKPRSLKETSNKPLPDTTSYMIIELLDPSVELFLLELQTGDQKKNLELEVVDDIKGVYISSFYFEVNQQYRIWIYGREKNTHDVIKGSTKVTPIRVKPRPLEASVEMIEPTTILVEFTNNFTAFCKVNGEPKPDIWWEDANSHRIDSEDFLLESPSTYISYATVYNATINSTIYCKCENAEGQDSLSLELFVDRDFMFEVLQYPSDQTIEYGTEGRLACEANAYPEASITWYHNDTTVEGDENLEVSVPDNKTLVIKNMNLDSVGEYKCEISNEVELKVYRAIIDISGLEAPSVEVSQSEYIIKPGDWVQVECKVAKGNPAPEVSWEKTVDGETVDMPDGVNIDDKSFKIQSAKIEHSGVYICKAANIQGEDAKEVILKVQYPPKMMKGDEIIKVKQGDWVELECDVDAEPPAQVTWTLYKDDVIINLDERHSTDERHNHGFTARSSDSGKYECVAENSMGRASRTVTVNVLVAPYIEEESRTVTARSGSSVMLKCNVPSGQPVPLTRWEFITRKSTINVLSKKNTTQLYLFLENLTSKDEGIYQCISENDVGYDSIKVFLKVQ